MPCVGKHALITGINGFTGGYMAAELSAAGYRVFGLGNTPGDKPDCFRVDLRDGRELSRVINQIKPAVVIHLAAIAFVAHGDASAFYNINLLGTRNLLQALSQCDPLPESILIASSANVYGNSTVGRLDENAPVNPANDYAVSKLAMEQMSRLWMDKLPIIISRPFNYTGVGQAENFLLPKLVKHYKQRASIIELGNLDVWRDFTDVRALSQACVTLLQVKPYGEIINICSGHSYSLRNIIGLCEKITGHHLTIHVNPLFTRTNEVKILCGDNTKLRRFIPGWKTPPLEDTLRWMLES